MQPIRDRTARYAAAVFAAMLGAASLAAAQNGPVETGLYGNTLIVMNQSVSVTCFSDVQAAQLLSFAASGASLVKGSGVPPKMFWQMSGTVSCGGTQPKSTHTEIPDFSDYLTGAQLTLYPGNTVTVYDMVPAVSVTASGPPCNFALHNTGGGTGENPLTHAEVGWRAAC